MNVVISAIAIGLSVFLLSVPLINRYVFHTVNIDAIIMSGREGLNKVQELQRDGQFEISRDSARSLIDRFRNDSLVFFKNDVQDWPAIRAMLMGEKKLPWSHIVTDNFDDEDMSELDASSKEVPVKVRDRFVYLLNFHAANDQFYQTYQDSITLDGKSDLQNRLNILVAKGVYTSEGARVLVKPKLTPDEKKQVRRFNELVIEKVMFPGLIVKDLTKNRDWASEFICQTAMYYIGVSYKSQFQLEEAIKNWNALIETYPKSIFAEVLFLSIGQSLFDEGRKSLADGQSSAAMVQFHEAIQYLEKIERNREVAKQFPKYKYADLTPDIYVNADVSSRAKSNIKTKTALYTTNQAASELSGKKGDDRSGYILEDAIKQIGEIYTQMGKTDSARMQYSVLLDFFPESDNRPIAQKLIAESYVKDGDLAMAKIDTSDKAGSDRTREKAVEFYKLGIKEFQKFINVYSQSDLISEVYISIGDAYYKAGEPKEAVASFQAALARAKEAEGQAKVQLQIGNYYFDRKRMPDAVEAYNIILNNFLSTQVAHQAQYMLGESYEALGDTVKSLKAFDNYMERYKSFSFMGAAAYKIGMRNMDRGNYKEALRAFGLGYTYDADGNLAPKTQFQTGMVWKKIAEGQTGPEKNTTLGEAIKQFKVVVDRFGGKAEEADQASYQIAECYMEMDNEKSAREAVKKIANRDLAVKSIKLFGIGSGENYQEEADYWKKAFEDAQEDEERATALYENAMVMADKLLKYEDAIVLFQQSLGVTTKKNKKINCLVGISRAYTNLKKFAEAESLYAQLVADPKVNEEMRQSLSVQMYDAQFKAKKTDQALEGFSNFVAQFPDHQLSAYATYRIGTILADQQKFPEAMSRFQIVLDKYSKSDMVDKATLGIGEQMIALGKHAEAVSYLEGYIKKNANVSMVPNIYMKIAETKARFLDKKKEAVDDYAVILRDYPDFAGYSYSAYQDGIILKDLGDDKAAIEIFGKVKKTDKGVYRAAQAEAGKLIAKTDPERAIGNYQQIVNEAESGEDSAIAIIGIGDVYTSMKNFGKAAEMFQKVHEFYKGVDTNLATSALVKWDDALLNGKKYNEVIRVAEIMQKSYPDNALTINTVYFEASAYFALNKYGQAREILDRIIKLNRSEQLTEIAYYQKGDSYYFGKEYKTAISAYDQYVTKYPKGRFAARAMNMQGNCHISLEEYAKARDKLLAVVNNYPEFEEMCVTKNYLAYSYNRLDNPDWKSAIKYYDQVIKSGKCTGKALEMAKEQREVIIGAH